MTSKIGLDLDFDTENILCFTLVYEFFPRRGMPNELSNRRKINEFQFKSLNRLTQISDLRVFWLNKNVCLWRRLLLNPVKR